MTRPTVWRALQVLRERVDARTAPAPEPKPSPAAARRSDRAVVV